MSEAIDYSALNWVRQELDELLKQARLFLDAYAANQGDATRLQDCANNLHTARSSLQMVGLKGADALASEMEEVIADLHGAPAQPESALEVLMQAFVKLSDYLSRLHPGKTDTPAVLLPVINSLREVRGAPLLEERAVFAPDLTMPVPPEVFVAHMSVPENVIRERARVARSRFQSGLLEWYRGNGSNTGLRALRDVLMQMQQDAGRESVARLWWAAAALTEAIIEGDIAATAEYKQLYGQLDRQIKRLIDVGESVFADPLTDELLKSVLYRIASTESSLECIQTIKATYSLQVLLDASADSAAAAGSLAVCSAELLQTVLLTSSEDIARIRGRLNMFAHGKQGDPIGLLPGADELHALGKMLGMVGIDGFGDTIAEQEQRIRDMATRASDIEEDALLDVANLLVEIEEALHNIDGSDALLEDGSADRQPPGEEIQGVSSEAVAGMVLSPEDEQPAVRGQDDSLLQQGPCATRAAADAPLDKAADFPEAPVITDLQVIGAGADEEILAIFIEEAEEVLVELDGQLSEWFAAVDDRAPLVEARRGFHTIKGSGRMVGALALGEFAWVFENLLNRAIDGSVGAGNELLDLVHQSVAAMTQLLAQVKGSNAALEADVDAMAREAVILSQPGQPSVDPVEASADEWPFPEEDPVTEDVLAVDPEILDIYSRECSEHLLLIEEFLGSNPAPCAVTATLYRSLHTISGISGAANVCSISGLAGVLDRYFDGLYRGQHLAGAEALNVLRNCATEIKRLIQQLPDMSFDEDFQQQLCAAVEVLPKTGATEPAGESYTEVDSEILEVFMEEASEIIDAGENTLRAWSAEPADRELMAEFQRQLHTLKGGARMVDIAPIGDLSHTLESLLTRVAEGQVEATPDLFILLHDSHDHLAEMLEHVKASEVPADACVLKTALEGVGLEDGDDGDPGTVDTTAAHEIMPSVVDAANLDAGPETVADVEVVGVPESGPAAEFEIESMHAIESEPEAGQEPEPKFETAAQRVDMPVPEPEATGEQRVEPDPQSLPETAAGQVVEPVVDAEPDTVAEEVVEPGAEPESETAAAQGAEPDSGFEPGAGQYAEPEQEASELEVSVEASGAGREIEAEAVEEHREVPPEPVVLPKMRVLPPKVERRKSPRVRSEQVRVRADLLDHMVSHAGEINIYRTRMEQQISDYRYNLGELDQTIRRLREQLRQVEIETEADILFRYGRENEAGDIEFDPLEMDRYSELQQLSRSLIESIGDLHSIQELLEKTTRESETLLLQQSRVSTDLQEGLLRSRMLPFSGIAPRLRRILRQSARELGKKVDLGLEGADGEMDRAVLEKIIAPLEHMLRNAVAHGIEEPDTRKQRGKPPVGSVTIGFEREGSEIVLRIEDDGAGLDIEAIRARAIERNLLDADAKLPDSDIMQFVLQTGFSTAAEVTQISGRGVGLDVVNGEVKQLGGSLHISSTAGTGTVFTVRLPYTLAVNQALLVKVGGESFCIPLGSIEGVARISPEELAGCYQSEHRMLEYADNSYELKHLGSLLCCTGLEQGTQQGRVPVLLARLGEKRVAFQLEAVLGSREIVIKPLGAQLGNVDGISGATILGDGRVVLILDLMSLSRMQSQDAVPDMTAASRDDERLHVMVVDDSITVRKVTTRLLEGNGFGVLTAKDGVDALGQLQENVPDMMLLDIEMPRMDGFELATHMRNDERLKHVPIIMITSRTGDKHRERAKQIGVNRYLGKPYQENELLECIQGLIDVSSTEECA